MAPLFRENHQEAVNGGAEEVKMPDGATWGQLLAVGQECLKNAGIAEFSLDAWYLFEDAFGISRMQYFMCSNQNADPSVETLDKFEAGIKRRAKREPLQHILGTQEFMGLEFFVNRHTLIPRQDTETLVETVLAEHRGKGLTILDMCTGSGCIAISLAAHGGYACVEAADISVEALKAAQKNAENLLRGWRVETAETNAAETNAGRQSDRNDETDGKKAVCENCGEQSPETEIVPGRICFRCSDMFSAFDEKIDKFDIIVSNPPYIPSDVIDELEPEVRDFEPRSALDGTADGLFFYEILARECGSFLNENGAVYFEIGHDQGEAVKHLLDANGFYDTKIIKDLAGKDRVVCGRWQTK